MLKKSLIAAAIIAVFSFLCSSPAASKSDVGAYLLLEKASQVVMLTHPELYTTGGTGFEVRTASGRVYTVSNAHVCGLAKDGLMGAHVPGSDRVIKVRVLDISDKDDLCLLEALPGASGLTLADTQHNHDHVNVLGHPHLHPITYAEGYLVNRAPVKVAEQEEKEKCTGPHQEFRQEQTLFGPMSLCLTTRDAYNTSLVIYPGNSGSPVFNDMGDVVGVVFAGMTDTNYGSIVPLDNLKEFLSVF